jgi:hypothetical protein
MHPYRSIICDALKATLKVFMEAERRYESSDEAAAIRVSIKWLNGPWLVKDSNVSDLPPFSEEMYHCSGSTPLFRDSLEVLEELRSIVAQRLVWVSDGCATDVQEKAQLELLSSTIASLLNPVSATAENTTQLIDFVAISLSTEAKSFYQQIGIPDDKIFGLL